ncbi:hypothetical protein Q9L42_015655 [Methylomarinum sp. Ch1-1]|uniref:Orphan protein n=1 Tax=Methylomarinum roseum TaxID=3067653 RepID=A0AAU7NS30_9GAMM|nr:hypothetical protein [Methylomarinum sp. Ch1-1]MDP4520227.1 hypothetical protein [Methylomarinum sp. Ch1-1]
MNPRMLEKIKLEHEAARLFMRLYEQRFGIEMRHIWHNEPKKPDVSCYLDGERLDLEIAHFYGSEEEAQLIQGREVTIRKLETLHRLINVPVDHRLLNALNTILANKAEKSYHSERVWLVLQNANPLWSRSDLEANLHQVTLPGAHPFEEIWFVGDMERSSDILRLFP